MENGKEDAILSRMLATIILDVPIPFDEELLRAKEIHKDKVKTLLQSLSFADFHNYSLGRT